MKLTNLFIAAMMAASLVSGCGTPEKTDDGKIEVANEWWNNPGLIRDRLAVIGSAPIIGNEANARDRAQTNGLGAMATVLGARVQQLRESWAKEVGDLAAGEESFTSLINDESITRVHTNLTIGGAHPHKFQKVGNTMYVLLVLQDPEKWTRNVVKDMKNRALADETLFKTQVMKDEFAKKMDAMEEQQASKVKAEMADLEKAVPVQ